MSTNNTSRHEEYQYLDLMQDILDNGSEKHDHNTGTPLYSVFGRQMRFDLSNDDKVPVLTTKKVYLKGVIHELVWFLRGMTNIRYLVQNNVKIWNDYPYKTYVKKAEAGEVPEMDFETFVEKIRDDEDFANEHGELPHVYGDMWRAWPATDGRKIDQLSWAMDNLKNFPHRKSTIVSAWDPEYLYSMALPGKALSYPLCHILYHFVVNDGKLSMLLYQRSCDMFLGVPFNIASYSILLKIVAHLTGYEPGEFVHTLGDAHIYGNHVDQVKEQLAREPMNFPKITIDPSLESLDELTFEHIIVEDYESHGTLRAEMTVAGGFDEKDRK